MDVESLIKQAHALAQSKPLYRYNPQTLEETIRKGVIPEGAVIAYAGDQVLVREGDEVVCYAKDSNGTKRPGKRTQIDDAMIHRLLVQYAVMQAYVSTHVAPVTPACAPGPRRAGQTRR
jgi:hypothetical protein